DNVEGYTLVRPKSTEVYLQDDNQNERFNQYGEIAGCAEITKTQWDELRQDVFFNDHHYYEIWKTGPYVIPFIELYKENIIVGVVKFIWIALVFAFIPATISYNIKLRRYQIFEYRRKMIDAMAHDLKTPMAAITAYAENLSNHIGTDKQEHYAEKIEEKVSEMNRMVSSILEFSKSEDTSVKIRKEETDIGQLIAKIISDNETTISERSLKVNFDQKSIMIKTDQEMFRQALANLIGNAVIHCKEGTAVDISCDKSSVIIINVTEENIENTAKLKQAFVKGSSSRGNKGTGLGLAIADNNLSMLGFKLDLKAEEDKFIATVKL
ncbi:MAG: HAMP domain-containing histidine kinase, partial [Clostridiales bacterium]|nr:HAMP domain-containing histidine kinase [Clostridiales bacterium]